MEAAPGGTTRRQPHTGYARGRKHSHGSTKEARQAFDEENKPVLAGIRAHAGKKTLHERKLQTEEAIGAGTLVNSEGKFRKREHTRGLRGSGCAARSKEADRSG